MKVLVTGGNGFLGSWIVRKLIDDGNTVRLLHRENSDLSNVDGLNFESALGDVTDFASLQRACDGVESVFHVAAVVGYRRNQRAMMENVNVQGTENIVQASIQARIKRFVHTSSVVAIGGSFERRTLNEESSYEMTPYDVGYFETKREAEEIVRAAARSNKLDAVIVNPGVVWGPGDAAKGSRRTHMKIAAGKVPVYTSGGCNVVGVDDVVQGHMSAFKKGRTGERYILGGENITIKRLCTMLAEFSGHRAPQYELPNFISRSIFRLGRITEQFDVRLGVDSESALLGSMFLWYDNAKARKELDFNPKPADAAIHASLHWAKVHGYLS